MWTPALDRTAWIDSVDLGTVLTMLYSELHDSGVPEIFQMDIVELHIVARQASHN